MKDAQIAQHAAAAGFKGDALTRAVAVAIAESGGDPKAVGVNSDKWRSRDRGLWQLNDHWHPEVTDAQAFNPATAAQAAYRISSGGKDWSPWATWPLAAGAQLGRARIAVAQAGQAPALENSTTADPAGFNPELLDPFSLFEGLTKPMDAVRTATVMVVKAGAWISDSHNWLRVAMVVGGTGGVVLGLAMLAKSGALGDTASSAAALPAKGLKSAATAGAMAATGPVGIAAKGATAVKAVTK